MALFGWTSAKQAALYTRRFNRAKLEKEAALLLAKRCFEPAKIEPPPANRIRTNTPTFSQ